MKKLTYAEQLKHPNWQRKRLGVLEAAGWKCTSCSTTETTLHVHHKRYVKGRMAWEYDDAELVALCETCHEADHFDREILDEILAKVDSMFPVKVAVGLLAGYMQANYTLDHDLSSAAQAIGGSHYVLGRIAAQLDTIPLSAIAALIRAAHVDDTQYWDPELLDLMAEIERLSTQVKALGDA